MRTLFFLIAGLCFLVGLGLSYAGLSRNAQRRIYWAAAGLASVCGFASGYPNVKNAVGVAVMLLAAMTFMAYVSTPYIKIGGKIYALALGDRQPDPPDPGTADGTAPRRRDETAPAADPVPHSYTGILTPATVWWALVVIAGVAAANTYAYLFSTGQAAPAAVGSGFLALLAIAGGYGDASWGYRIARGQHLPFAVATVITAGSFALVYLAAYSTARRLPLRRNRSLEYQAHPRHRQPPP